MAFRLPTQAPSRPQVSFSRPERPTLDIKPLSQQQDDDAQEWVLFSPSQATSTARTRTASTERTARTAGLSRLSDFGSLNAATHDVHDEASEVLLEEDATELDSLDDGLHHFRDSHVQDATNPVLPAHDGLGSFLASDQLAQQRLWQYEQYNPQRLENVAHTRRSSVQRHLETVEEQESQADRDRWQRIEKWRTDQNKILMQEIERETKRRQRLSSRTSLATSRRSETDILDSISETRAMDTSSSTESSSTQRDSPEESFWRRITRRVIRDLIGIDDSILSVILGESLVAAPVNLSQSENASFPTLSEIDREMKDTSEMSGENTLWQERLLQRIARELGILVHQIWEHPGAFSTYLRNDGPADYYAGMPISRSEAALTSQTSLPVSNSSTTFSTFSPHFTPTLRNPVTTEYAAQWGIEDDEIAPDASPQPMAAEEPLSESARLNQEHDYWERELDIMVVFRYLKNRFRRGDPGHTSANPPGHSTQDASSRANVIRQNHPLVARAHARSQAQYQRQQQLRTPGLSGLAGPASPITRHRFRRPSSSRASQSTKLSAKRTHAGLGSGSSRHYWDIGGSVGSGSAVVSVGGPAGVGAWGEI